VRIHAYPAFRFWLPPAVVVRHEDIPQGNYALSMHCSATRGGQLCPVVV